jgi:hypothetical protein
MKPEIQTPKSETRKGRLRQRIGLRARTASDARALPAVGNWDFGLRVLRFYRISDLGFRISPAYG